jgi:retinol dehydrogenase-12
MVVVLALLGTNHYFDGRIRQYWPKPKFLETDIPNLKGKVAIITGANTGLGKESAYMLARKGCTVILACRTPCHHLAQDIEKETGSTAISLKLDLSDSVSIYQFNQDFRKLNLPINILMLNAGVMNLPEFTPTKDGLEMQIGVNWIGHFYLQQLLQDIVEQSAPSRVIILSSVAHKFFFGSLDPGCGMLDTEENRRNYGPRRHYRISKLLNIYHANELHTRMQAAGKQVSVLSIHPGAVDTDLGRHMFEGTNNIYMRAISDIFTWLKSYYVLPVHYGALTQIWAATSLEVEDAHVSGSYITPIGRLGTPSKLSQDIAIQKRVWREAEEVIARFPRNE